MLGSEGEFASGGGGSLQGRKGARYLKNQSMTVLPAGGSRNMRVNRWKDWAASEKKIGLDGTV